MLVSTSEEIDARVMDFEEIEGSENSTCIGNRIGKVVRVWASVNQTEDGMKMINLNHRRIHLQVPLKKRIYTVASKPRSSLSLSSGN